VSSITLESSVIIVVAAAMLFSRFPRLWFGSDGKLRPVIHLLAWVSAGCILALNSLARQIYDDEVFYLAQAYAAQRGEVYGYLPMRVWMFYPYLALHLSPAATLLVGRVSMIFASLLAGVIVMYTARKVDRSGFTGSMAGALTTLTFGNLPTGSLVPEYVALLFLLLAIWAIVAPPTRWPRAFSVFMGGLMLALACTTSLRFLLFGVAGLIVILLEPGKLRRVEALFWTILGILAGLLPSALHIAAKDSIASIVYWNYTFVRRMGLININSRVELPAVAAAIAMVGCYFLWCARKSLGGSITLILLWMTATLSAILNPQKYEFTLGPWLALSFILATAAMSSFLTRGAALGNRRVYILALSLLLLTQMLPNAPTLANPALIKDAVRQADSGLRLINWLGTAANGSPVACVAPFHPVRAPNAWRMWNVNYYCYIKDPQLNSELGPDLENMLRSKIAAVVQWDPWPGESEQANILQYLVNRKFVPQDRIVLLTEELRKAYKLVQWSGPLPEEFGGGRFLVRRDIKLDNRVCLLDDSMIQ
jgi:hypothetical protein